MIQAANNNHPEILSDYGPVDPTSLVTYRAGCLFCTYAAQLIAILGQINKTWTSVKRWTSITIIKFPSKQINSSKVFSDKNFVSVSSKTIYRIYLPVLFVIIYFYFFIRWGSKTPETAVKSSKSTLVFKVVNWLNFLSLKISTMLLPFDWLALIVWPLTSCDLDPPNWSGHHQLHLWFWFGLQDDVVNFIKGGSLKNPTIPLQNLITWEKRDVPVRTSVF